MGSGSGLTALGIMVAIVGFIGYLLSRASENLFSSAGKISTSSPGGTFLIFAIIGTVVAGYGIFFRPRYHH